MKLSPKESRLLRHSLLVAVFIAIGYFVFHHLDELRGRSFTLRWPFVLYALGFTLLGHLCSYVIWTRIARSFDMRSSWSHAGKAWFLSRLGRYVPGKISLLLLRFQSYGTQSKTKISAATLIEAYTSLAAATLLLVFYIVSATPATGLSLAAGGGLFLLLIALSHPTIVRSALFYASRFLPISQLKALPTQVEILVFVVGHLLTLLLHGAALFMVFNAVGNVGTNLYLLITAVYFIAGLIGAAALFAPSGIGVREATLFALLAAHLEAATLIVGVVIIRLIVIVSEISLSGFFILSERFSPRTCR